MIYLGDSLEVLKTFPENSVDAVVTDPPYGWRFMGKAWDAPDIAKTLERDKTLEDDDKTTLGMAAGKYDNSLSANQSFQVWTEYWAREAMRVLKPGGHMMVFCGPRTYHRMASGVEDAGFEIRDQLQWIFSGFPKSHNIGNGRGTALKPANEPIVLARKPLSESTVKNNVLKWSTGSINIDASRIPETLGRWPSNCIFDEEASKMLDEQSGVSKSVIRPPSAIAPTGNGITHGKMAAIATERGFADSGGASRFFYCAKSSKSERSRGINGVVNSHPCVKPQKLMEYLVRLITPPGGTVLDPFMGSGSTGVACKKLGFEFIGIEMNEEYVEIAKKRCE